MALHMMKLVVGMDSLQEFAKWQSHERLDFKGRAVNVVYTRHMPKQVTEILLSGGSIYRVIKGVMRCRQKILGFDRVETSQGTKSIIYTDTEIMRTHPLPKRAFQGWRYLKEDGTPQDVAPYAVGDELPPAEMEAELSELGLL